MARRRILTVIDSLHRGGAERLLVTTHGRLSRRRYDLRVASLFGQGELEEELREMKVKVYPLRLSAPSDLPRAVLRLRKLITSLQVDIVHTHLFFSNVAGRMAAAGKASVVTTLHNPDYGEEAHPGMRFRIRKALDRATGKHLMGRFIAVSDAVRRDYEEHMPFPGIQVIPNCIDVAGFKDRVEETGREQIRTAHGLAPDHVAILHVGRFHRQKAQDHLLRSFRLALTEDPRLRLLLAGDGATLTEARVLAEELDLADAVVFLGRVADVAPLYRCADIFTFPSRYEAFGIALLEAMAAGLPAVVSRVGGIPELATDDTAIFVEPDREEVLARGLLELAQDPGRRREMGRAAERRAADFDVTRWVPRLEAVYASL